MAMAEPEFHYPRVSRRKFLKWNEAMFLKYNNERVYDHANPLIRFVEQRRVAVLLRRLGRLKTREKVLAAGCGEGHIESQIKRGELYMVDLSREALKRARETLPESKRVKYFLASVEKLPFEDEFFDKIECSEVIEHVYVPQKMIKEFSRVLKIGGTLVISFPNEPFINLWKKIFINLGIFYKLFPNVPLDMTDEWHLHAFELKKFLSLIDGSWLVKAVDRVPFWFFPVRYVVTCRKSS